MKRILPVILVLAILLLALISCREKETPTTTVDLGPQESSRTTTSKVLDMGIEEKDEGWAFWTER